MEFELDSRLAADTVFVADWELCRVLLHRDARYGWLILVPRRPEMVEMMDLSPEDYARLWAEIRRASEMLRLRLPCDKLNVAALGNMVPQLHVHVIARRHGDTAWPNPVWGRGEMVPYSAEELAKRVKLLSGL